MPQIIYVLQFKGSAAPVEGAEGQLAAATKASSAAVQTAVGADGVASSIEPIAGGEASFESAVKLTGETSFQETGTIRFGAAAVHFSTVGEGYIGPSVEEGVQHGCVSWRIDRGEGSLEGATGLITSNFTVNGAGEVVDNHFGVIWVK